jgi:hypothetical protein
MRACHCTLRICCMGTAVIAGKGSGNAHGLPNSPGAALGLGSAWAAGLEGGMAAGLSLTGASVAIAQTHHNQPAPTMLVYPVQQARAHLLAAEYSSFQGSCKIFGYWHPVDWDNNVYGIDNYGNPINMIVGSVTQIQGNVWSFYFNQNGRNYNVYCQ